MTSVYHHDDERDSSVFSTLLPRRSGLYSVVGLLVCQRYGVTERHGPFGTQAVAPFGPNTAHGPPGIAAEPVPSLLATAPGPSGTSAPDPCGPAAGVHGVPSGLKHGGGGGGSSAAAIGASAIDDAAAPANKMDVIAFFSVAFMLVGYHGHLAANHKAD
jgi:hypothetical protein